MSETGRGAGANTARGNRLNSLSDALINLIKAQHQHETLDGFIEIGPKVMGEITVRFGKAQKVITAV